MVIAPSMSQDKPLRNFSFEAGMDFLLCEPPDNKEYIRADIIQYNYYYPSASYVMALFYKNYYGLKYENRFFNNKLAVVSGIRYTRTDASIGKDTYWSSKTDYFYFLYSQEGTTTEYLRVKSITQKAHYLGIPLEFRIYPYEERTIQLYYKVGLDFNFLVGDNADVVFQDQIMNQYEKDIREIVEDPWKFYATAGLAIGLKIGDSGKPGINIEACIPSGIMKSSGNSFVSPLYGAGIQFNIRFPF
jgi:hypothetical protein